MKRLLFISILAFAMASCVDKYDLNTNFTSPTELFSPEGTVNLDINSSTPIVLAWNGGGAADGTLVLYDVFIADAEGSFDTPALTRPADSGLNQVSIPQSEMNLLAKRLGAAPEGKATIKWTVRASKGGDMKFCPESKSFEVKRPAGLASIPDKLYLYGSATANDVGGGQEFRQVSEGKFEIFTVLTDGDLCFKSSTAADAANYFIGNDGKLTDDDGTMTVTATDLDAGKNYLAERITVDFNTLSMKREKIGELHIIWASSYGDMGPAKAGAPQQPQYRFTYAGNGVFTRTIDKIVHPFAHPAWGNTSSDDRYYFNVKIDDVEMRWRFTTATPSGDAPAVNTPLESYSIAELLLSSATQWDNCFKLNSSLKNASNVVVKIYGNKDGYFCHQFE